ncbi:MAG: large-conductance mechanosensitive channel protein MscL [Candidatus Brevundimonas colombiensis]|jgi:large conductance mechanosensitive channel|uniref:Large-conductance mechanosensitive channel n=1 Tax=Candidatus Brevundimonas colombiensis TaxID=3121376 RepID=A0AAJ5X1P3_9CAUL|nr:large-conductance mechanosensitive channel protein MscL [Brevundimonas sp.]WEK41379.1 MAG: large-conductance mechanosensitive channel protein MscL [Brevundimonas sp.]
MGLLTEFREFAVKGNVVDLAVGVIIGGAFGKIVTSLVDQVIMPPIGWLIGGINFSDLKITLPVNPTNPTGEPAVIEYGAFINVLIQFVIVAFVIFMMVKLINKMRRQEAAKPDPAPAAPTATEALLTEIRDELKARPNG